MFCQYCGTKLANKTRFCTTCGAEQQQGVTQAQGSTAPPARRLPQSNVAPASAAVPGPRKKRSVIPILVAILVMLVGFQFMSLSIVGKTTTATVTSARQDRKSYGESSPNPNRYRIQYTFSVQGKPYAGGTSTIFKQGIREDQKISVRYLPYYPGINSLADETNIMSGLLLTGLGGFLLVMGAQGKATITLGRRKRTKEHSVLNDDRRR